MELLKILNMAAAFFVEIALLISLGKIGFSLKARLFWQILAALALVGLTIFIWSMWFAPQSPTRLELPWLAVGKFALFGLTSVGLYLTGNKSAAFTLLGVFTLIETLAIAWGQEDPSVHGE